VQLAMCVSNSARSCGFLHLRQCLFWHSALCASNVSAGTGQAFCADSKFAFIQMRIVELHGNLAGITLPASFEPTNLQMGVMKMPRTPNVAPKARFIHNRDSHLEVCGTCDTLCCRCMQGNVDRIRRGEHISYTFCSVYTGVFRSAG